MYGHVDTEEVTGNLIMTTKLGKSKKQTAPTKKPLVSRPPSEHPELQDPELVSENLLECIRAGDLDAFRSVLSSHITSSNKVHLAKKTGLGRQTLYDIIDPEKTFNPALSTVAAIFRGLTE